MHAFHNCSVEFIQIRFPFTFFSVTNGLRVLREVQMEVRQMDACASETDTASNTSKQGDAASGGISV